MDAITWLDETARAVGNAVANLWTRHFENTVCFAVGDRGVVAYATEATVILSFSCLSSGADLENAVDQERIDVLPMNKIYGRRGNEYRCAIS
jgi:hypothetical protein